jgi:hypothetical protein
MVFCRIILTRRGENVNTDRITFYLFKFLFLFREYLGYFLGRLGLWYIPPGGYTAATTKTDTNRPNRSEPPNPNTSKQEHQQPTNPNREHQQTKHPRTPARNAKRTPDTPPGVLLVYLLRFIISYKSIKGKSKIHNIIIAPPPFYENVKRL